MQDQAPDTMTPSYLSTVGHYKLIKELDSDGSASRNFQCQDTTTNQLLQCKVMKPEKFSILRKAAARLRADRLAPHTSSIVARIIPAESKFIRGRIANAVDEFQYYWFYNESHGDLHAHVRDSKGLEEAEARLLFRQIVELTALCHSRGIILRDVKLRKFVFTNDSKTQLRLESLDNIVVLPEPNDELLQERHACPAYCAPELLLPGKPLWNGRQSDCYSCGVILFVMLLGRYPFYDANAVMLFRKIRNDRLYVPTRAARSFRIPEQVLVLIKCILRKAPEERPTLVDVLAHPWLTPKQRVGYGSAPEVQFSMTGILVPLIPRTDQIVPGVVEYYSMPTDEQRGCIAAEQRAEAFREHYRGYSLDYDFKVEHYVPNVQ